MSIKRFTNKEVVVASSDEAACVVAAKMNEKHVGAVVVLENSSPVGIVTDRDLALRVVADRLPPEVRVGDVMSEDLVVVREDESIDVAVARMREKGVRRLPIVDGGGALVGMMSLDDIEVLLAGELGHVAHAIRDNRGP